MEPAVSQNLSLLGTFLLRLVAALIVLLIGWLIARFLSGLVRKLLGRAGLDKRTTSLAQGERVPRLENGIATVVFWAIMLLALVAFFQVLGLAAVTQALNVLIGEILLYLPKLAGAAILALIAWIVATILRAIVRRALEAAGVDKRVGSQSGTEAVPISRSVSEAVYWFVWLLFLPAIIGALGLVGLLLPIQSLVDQILGFLPNLLAAAIILIVGWFVARIVQRIVTSLLAAIGIDRFSERIGLAKVLGKQTLSGLIGLFLFVIILIPVILAALQALQLSAITQPITVMLSMILAAIPVVIAAFIVLAVAYVIARLVGELVANLLAGLGFDNILVRLGLAGVTSEGGRTPSQIVGYLVMVAIMLFAVLGASSLLHWQALNDLLAEFLVFAGHIIMGLIILGIGLWLANLIAKVIEGTNWQQKRLVVVFARVAIVALALAMALRQMGIANEIINLAFGLTLGAIAVAIALAFGLGGRDIAARQLDDWSKAIKSEEPK